MTRSARQAAHRRRTKPRVKSPQEIRAARALDTKRGKARCGLSSAMRSRNCGKCSRTTETRTLSPGARGKPPEKPSGLAAQEARPSPAPFSITGTLIPTGNAGGVPRMDLVITGTSGVSPVRRFSAVRHFVGLRRAAGGGGGYWTVPTGETPCRRSAGLWAPPRKVGRSARWPGWGAIGVYLLRCGATGLEANRPSPWWA